MYIIEDQDIKMFLQKYTNKIGQKKFFVNKKAKKYCTMYICNKIN